MRPSETHMPYMNLNQGIMKKWLLYYVGRRDHWIRSFFLIHEGGAVTVNDDHGHVASHFCWEADGMNLNNKWF